MYSIYVWQVMTLYAERELLERQEVTMVRRVLTRPRGPSIMYILFCDLLPLCEQQHCVIAMSARSSSA